MKKRSILLCLFQIPCFAIEIETDSSIATFSFSNENRICHTDIPEAKVEQKGAYFCDECYPRDFKLSSITSKKGNEKNERLVAGYIRRHSSQNIPEILIEMCHDFSRKYPVCEHVHEYLKKLLRNEEGCNAEDDVLEVMAIYNLETVVKDYKKAAEYLYLAAFSKMNRVLEMFIAYGHNTNTQYYPETTFLHVAVVLNRKELAALLIKNGANVNAKDKWSSAPLHRVAENGSKELAALLIKNGADVNAKGHCGYTPLDIAKKNKNKENDPLLEKFETDLIVLF